MKYLIFYTSVFGLPQLKRATVQNYKTGELEVASYRISKSAWLREEEHRHIAAVAKRVEDISGLTCSTAEELQVVNYGIGGHYEPHFDFARVGAVLYRKLQSFIAWKCNSNRFSND